jgi:hypothetical protein
VQWHVAFIDWTRMHHHSARKTYNVCLLDLNLIWFNFRSFWCCLAVYGDDSLYMDLVTMYAFLCLCMGVTVVYAYTHTKQPDTYMVIENIHCLPKTYTWGSEHNQLTKYLPWWRRVDRTKDDVGIPRTRPADVRC